MSIVAQTPPHRNESADAFVHDAATLSLRSSRSCYVLYVLTTTKALPRRLELLGTENLGASVTSLLRSYCALVALATFQLRSCYVLYVLTTTKALPRRLELLGIENLGASVTSLLRSYCALVALATFQLRLCYAIGD